MTTTEKKLDINDVKSKLFETLKTRGVLDSLKSQLRTKLIYELQDSTGLSLLSSSVKGPLDNTDNDGVLLCKKITNSLVAEHLKTCKYEYTLSTFLPESGSSVEKIFSLRDILSLLHFNEESKLYKNLERSLGFSKNNKGFLWQFLLEITALHNKNMCDAGTQTEQNSQNTSQSLEEKLSNVEKEFSEKFKLTQLDRKQGIEEKLIAVQKNYELQKNKELEDEVKKFKTSEISRLRLEEREKYEAEIKKIRAEYDQEFRLKRQALRVMEKETLERLQRLQEDKETGAYNERQKILQEISLVKERETELRNTIELHKRTQKIEEEKLSNEASRLNILEESLKERGKFHEEKYKTEIERFKRDYRQQLSTKENELLRQESNLKAEKEKLEAERNVYLECQENFTTYKERNTQLQALVETWELRFEKLKIEKAAMEGKLATMKDYETLKEREIALKKDVEHLTQRLEETRMRYKEKDKRQQSMVKELSERAGRPSKEVLELRKEIKEVKEKCKLKEKLSNEAKKITENRLNTEIQRSDHFQTLYEEQLTHQKLMEDEIIHLKMIQQQTEQLLSMELRHQKAVEFQKSATLREKRHLEKGNISQPVESLSRKLDTDDSSYMDESSMVSVTENKKIFQKLEKEAEALDASYRDFQNRMRQPQSHTIGGMPSAMSFHRLPSYHSAYSPQKTNNFKDSWVNLNAPSGEFNPLHLYEGSRTSVVFNKADTLTEGSSKSKPSKEPRMGHRDSESRQQNLNDTKTYNVLHKQFESGELAVEENVPLTLNDLENNKLYATQTKHSVKHDTFRQIETLQDNIQGTGEPLETFSLSEKEEEQLRKVSGGISRVAFEPKTSFHDNLGPAELKESSEISTGGKTSKSLNRTVSYDSGKEDVSATSHHIEVTLDKLWEKRENVVSSGHNRTNTSLDMEELEKRRQKDDDFENLSSGDESGKLESNGVNTTEHVQLGNNDTYLSVETEEKFDVEVSNIGEQEEVAIDPLMLKYMEMIKQRRESENKEHSDKHSDILLENDDDDDVSIGKLSDEDFTWE